MNLTAKMIPQVGETKYHIGNGHQPPYRPAEPPPTAFSRCECLRCRGGIEFETSAFQEKMRTNLFLLGQGIQCPHCGATTSIYLVIKSGKVALAGVSKG
jgi:hypothetical protein